MKARKAWKTVLARIAVSKLDNKSFFFDEEIENFYSQI